jgi:hypothetical protein
MVLPWIAVVVAISVAAPAWAADPKIEKEAQALQKKAIEEDNLNVDYPAAVKKLQSALAKCDGDKCSSGLKASLLRDLGAMQILGGSQDEGKASFAQALSFDSSIDLDPAYKNPQLEAIWADVKKKGGAPPPSAGGAQPSGDFAHVPAPEQQVRTPLAIYAEYSGSEKLAKVIVKYKGAGMADWKALELQKVGSGYGSVIPCKDVALGDMQYYLQGFNAANDPVATSGSRNKPFTVPIKPQIAGPPPSLPGQEAPKQCSEMVGEECPPNFPGCKAAKKEAGEDCEKDLECKSNSCIGGKCIEKKGGGDECQADSECASGSCSDGKCTSAKKAEGEDCGSDDECDSGSCAAGKCGGGGGGKGPKIFIGIAVQGDIYLVPGANDVCLLNSTGTAPVNTAGYNCVDPNTNVNFPDTTQSNAGAINGSIQKGHSDQVAGGSKFGNLRLMLSVDYALNANMLVGVRGGYVLFTNPATGNPGSAFGPVHVEGRFTYLVGKDALTKRGVSPMVFFGGGVGEFDAYVPVFVYTGTGTTATQLNENAWITAGPGFATLGGGVRAALGPKVAATLALKLEAAFGGSAGFLPGFAPEGGVQVGF